MIFQSTVTAVMSKYFSDTRPRRKKKKEPHKMYLRSLEVLRTKLQDVMTFQTCAYYINHSVVTKNNYILSKFMAGLTFV